jgi:predicted transcriptional regulator
MSARAASRLERFKFSVYRYQAGKADWFAAGLPREGRDARTPRLADVATRDLPLARLEEWVGNVRERVGVDGAEPVIVVDASAIVLGLVEPEMLKGDPQRPIEEVMDPGPVTFRPNLQVGEMPEYFKRQGIQHALVTTSDGVLIGLVHRHAR